MPARPAPLKIVGPADAFRAMWRWLAMNSPTPVTFEPTPFDGELPATGNRGSHRSEKKWLIRRHFFPQFEELWGINPALRRIANGYFVSPNSNFIIVDTHHQIGRSDPPSLGTEGNRIDLCAPIDKFGRKFKPIVRESFALICSLDILFLRKEKPGRIYQGGDLDGRIRTLLDALSVPQHQEQMKGAPETNEVMPCLLEDDSLVTKVTVQSERLLTAPDADENVVRLIIGVDVRVSDSRSYNTLFLGD